MAEDLLRTARFHTTVAQARQFPRGGQPEVAFVGRSNAGKSSAVNRLCGQKKLAFASKTPGRTQALNYFSVGQKREDDPVPAYLVDTPGYGYAQAGEAQQQNWGHLSGRYLSERLVLKGVVLVLDIRRGLTEKDQVLIDFCRPEVPVLMLLSKSDKLSRQQQQKQLQALQDQVAAFGPKQHLQFLHFSSTSGQGLAEATQWVLEQLGLTNEEMVKANDAIA